MSDRILREKLIKLANENPQIADQIEDVLKTAASEFGAVDDLLKDIRNTTAEFIKYQKRMTAVSEALGDLIQASDANRVKRSEGVQVSDMKFDGKVLEGKCQTSSNTYNTRLSLFPKKAFNCTCPDRSNRGRSVGPCKHAIALGRAFWNDKLAPELEDLEAGMRNVTAKQKLLK